MNTLLIVDDDINTLHVLRLMLEEEGFRILTAEDGEQGLNSARENRPQVIITDVLMPVMDGYEFYKCLKADPITKNLPVIILTARGAMEPVFEAIGVDCFLEKPAERTELVSKINQLLQFVSRPSGSGRQRVMIGGTYSEIVDEMASFVRKLGHEVQTAATASQVLTQSVSFRPTAMILEIQTETGDPAADLIRAVRLLPDAKTMPVLVYSYYRVSELGSDDFRRRTLNIETAKDACISAGATEYFDRYNSALFQEQIVRYL